MTRLEAGRIKVLVTVISVATLVGCATAIDNSILEVSESEVRSCQPAGQVNGADAIFVGMSAAVGTRNAKARALNQASELRATHVVWSQMGTSLTNEWIGQAYRCSESQTNTSQGSQVPDQSLVDYPLIDEVVNDRDSIIAMQTIFQTMGLYQGAVDGLIGPQSVAAIEQYQRILGLPVTGVLTQSLLERLRN